MAIKGRVTTEQTVQAGTSKLFTGIAAWRVVAINPTQEQLKAMGFKAEKEPVYSEVKEGVRNTRIQFYLEATAPGGHKIKTNAAFFIKNKLMDGVFINKFGRYGKDRTKLSGELRTPYDGEIDLLGFIADWADVSIKKGAEEELYLDSIKKIAETGDIFEIRQILKNLGDNIFKGLATVSEGKYQRVYTKRTARAWTQDYSRIHESLVQNEKHVKEDLGGIDLKLYVPAQFVLKEWKGQSAELAQAAASSSNGNGSHSNGVQGEQTANPEGSEGDDDTPF